MYGLYCVCGTAAGTLRNVEAENAEEDIGPQNGSEWPDNTADDELQVM